MAIHPGLCGWWQVSQGRPLEWSAGSTCGKPLGLAALAVWQRAQSTAVSGSTGLTADRIVGAGMAGQRSVAGLAVHVRMLAGLLLVRHIRVAGSRRSRGRQTSPGARNFADGRPAIVPILAKALGHNVVAHHQKHQEGEDKEPRKPEKMPCILENTHQTLSTTPLQGDSGSLCLCDLEHSPCS